MCDECPGLREALKDAYEVCETLQKKIEVLQKELTVQLMQKGKLKAAQERENGEGAQARIVIEIIEFWAMETGHTKAKVSAAGARGDAVRKALKLGHSVEELKEAIVGAAKYPFVVNRQRSATGTEKQRYDDLPTVFRDEVQIQRMRKLSGLQPEPTGEPSEVPISVQEQWRRLNYPQAKVMAALWDCGVVKSPNPDTWTTDCPIHFGPGLVARRHESGMMSVDCVRGCEFWRLLAGLGLEASDLFENCEQDPARQSADDPKATPAHLQEATGILISQLQGLAGK